MWIPQNEQDIVTATANNTLEETVTFDAKKEFPGKGIETAKDVSALANTAGGVLLYGIGEDGTGRPTVLSPIELAGRREWIDQVVRTSIDEVPSLKISAIPTAADSSKGYLVVVVPPSERAPHMVIVKGERRFYGRGETGNYILSQTEVARLYERRQLTESNILPLLKTTVGHAPLATHDKFAHLHLVAKPVLNNDKILSKAAAPGEKPQDLLHALIKIASNFEVYPHNYSPNFVPVSEWTRRPEGYFARLHYASEDDPRPDAHTLHLQVNLDGSAHLFCGRAAETLGGHPPKFFMSVIVAGNTIRFLRLLGELYDRASYFGMVDIGVAVTGLSGCAPYETRDMFFELPRFIGPDYYRTMRTSAALLKENPKQAAAELLMPLVDAISQGTDDPFKDK